MDAERRFCQGEDEAKPCRAAQGLEELGGALQIAYPIDRHPHILACLNDLPQTNEWHGDHDCVIMNLMNERGHEDETDWAEQLDSLERDGQISAPWVGQAIRWLIETAGNPIAHVIDVGSGPGYAACTWAQTVPSAHVAALDPIPVFLERTRQRADEFGLGGRVSTHAGDIESTLPTLPRADLVWSSHVIHHLPDPIGALRILGDRLTKGGRVAIAEGGLPMRVLPTGYGVGRPSFISRLEATLSDYYLREWDLVPAAIGGSADWPLMLREAGLTPVATRSFLVEFSAPVDNAIRAHVVNHFEHVRERIGGELDRADAIALDRLLSESGDESLRVRPDLFLLTAQTVHVATAGDGNGD